MAFPLFMMPKFLKRSFAGPQKEGRENDWGRKRNEIKMGGVGFLSSSSWSISSWEKDSLESDKNSSGIPS